MGLVRARCITSPALLIAILAYNLWIARSYIPIGWRLMRLRKHAGGHIFKRGEVRLLAVFVASCGILHALMTCILFFPILDWPAVAWGFWTGFISARARKVLAEGEGDLLGFVIGFRELHRRVYGTDGAV